MSDPELVSEDSKTALENSVSWYLADKLADANTAIATKKYLTSNNLLVYLTRCNVAELTVPRIKVQVLQRVKGGVHETGYQLFGDHRLEKYQNNMIFGAGAGNSTTGDSTGAPVTEIEAKQLLELVSSLQSARQTL
ncbi:MAG TPA: hypothetical protein VLI05_02665 [Candidatus Saccharimonadia bacterium]|nr:hypothetical protein [Candidatus Saccharimonadia bacterium]